MKKWVQKLVEQLDLDWKAHPHQTESDVALNEEKATLLFILDIYSKHLIEIDSQPTRKVRETLDEFSKEIIKADDEKLEKTLFRFRQFFNTYRIQEYSYVQKTFDDFRSIIWDFVDQLSEDLSFEKESDSEVKSSLNELKEAVEANSIDSLKIHSRQFIDSYTELQTRKDRRRAARMDSFKKNLDTMKKQLTEAHSSLRVDHLTQALNRKSYEEQIKNAWNLHSLYQKTVSVIMLDIDHFKKINDNFGHPMGDFILQECVKSLRETFCSESECVARIGGEEFAVVLMDFDAEKAAKLAEFVRTKIQADVYVVEQGKLQYTISMGVAELQPNEALDAWVKRADAALYESKNSGRNRITISGKKKQQSVA